MAWPLTPFASFTDAVTPWNAAFANALQSATNGLYTGTSSIQGAVIDGLGAQAFTRTAASPLVLVKDIAGATRWGLNAGGLPNLGGLTVFREDWSWIDNLATVSTNNVHLNGRTWFTEIFGASSVAGIASVDTAPNAYSGGALVITPGPASGRFSYVHNYVTLARVRAGLSISCEWDSNLGAAGANGTSCLQGLLSAGNNNNGDPFTFGFAGGVFFQKLNGDTNWKATTANSVGGTTVVDTGVAPVSHVWQTFKVEFYGASSFTGATTARFYINNALVATITTTPPLVDDWVNFWCGGTATSASPTGTKLGYVEAIFNRF